MVDAGSQGQQRPAEQTAEQSAVPASAAGNPEAEAVTSEFVAGAQQPSTSYNGFEADSEPAFDPHPEFAIGGAFVGGFLLGRLMRRLGK